MFNVVKVLTESEGGAKVLFSNGRGDYLVASYSTVFEVPECLLFKSDENGKISDWSELYGNKFYSDVPRNSAIFSVVSSYNKALAENNYVGAWG